MGAVATQSVIEPAYGPEVLDRLEAGAQPGAALAELLAADELARLRQVGVVDAAAAGAVHTGADCIAHAGHVTGDGFGCQANMMASDAVPAAMAAAFQAAQGELADRLLAALEGAEIAGGDVRGRQSSALLVVPADGPAWYRGVELRVEDDVDPVRELARLLALQRAYALADRADAEMGAGRAEEAGRLYRRAAELAPDSDELLFWSGLALAHAGDLHAGAEVVAAAGRLNPGWRVLLARLSPEFAPAGAAVRTALGWDEGRPSAG